MRRRNVLSSEFNMSLGFMPVVISIFLCNFLAQDVSLYIGTVIGIIWSYCLSNNPDKYRPNFILYFSTILLFVLSLTTLAPREYVPEGKLPITLETSLLLLLLTLFIQKRRFVTVLLTHARHSQRALFAQSAEAAIVSARIALITGLFHVVAIGLTYIISSEPNEFFLFTLYVLLPDTIFILIIILNQIAIHSFNKLMGQMEYIPIVNAKGDVIGKSTLDEVQSPNNRYLTPIVRIAAYTDEMIFLCERSKETLFDLGKVDVPMECYVRYGESLPDAVQRLFRSFFPKTKEIEPQFNILYHFKNNETNRLIYLFLLNIESDTILKESRLAYAKLWSFKQIEANLGKNYFSRFFEEEYDYLRDIIYIKEKYKES
ncbi:MAG: hypothetical protein EOM31_08985 [Bacteroidia bacterium]|nr:hypothetical protein [Bacteroidia bacterium]